MIMVPGPWALDFRGALRRRLLIAKPQYFKNREAPVRFCRAPHAEPGGRYEGDFRIPKSLKWHSGIEG